MLFDAGENQAKLILLLSYNSFFQYYNLEPFSAEVGFLMQRMQPQAGDRELEPERVAAQGAAPDAQRYFADGQKLMAAGTVTQGIDCLRKAAELDDSNRAIRAAFLNALLEQARTRLKKDWRESKLLVQEALKLDGSNPLARSLLAQIQNRERQALVEACACEARELQAVGNFQGALAKVRHALAQHPRESRLSQLESALISKLGGRARAQVQETPAVKAQAPQADSTIRIDPPPGAGVAEIKSGFAAAAAAAPARSVVPARSAASIPAPVISKPPVPLPSASAKPSVKPAKATLPNWSRVQWAIVAGVVLLLFAAFATYKLIKDRHSVAVVAKTELRANVAEVKFLLDGKPVEPPVVLSPGQEHVLEAIHEGYESSVQNVTPSAGQATAPIQFMLRPLPPRLQVWSDLQGVKVSVGKQPAVTLESSHLDVKQMSSGTQMVKVFDGAKQIFSVALQVEPGKRVNIAGPVETDRYSVAIASILGAHARVFTTRDLKGSISGEPQQTIPAGGIELEIKPGSVFQLSNEETIKLEPGNQPSVILSISTTSGETDVHATPQTANLLLSAIPRDAEIHVDGESRGPAAPNGIVQLPLSAAAHKIYLSRPHFEDSQTITVNLLPGRTEKVSGERFVQVQQGALVFKVSPSSANVTFQLADAQQSSPVRRAGSSDTVWVKPGKYLIKVEAAGFVAEQDQYEVKSASSVDVTRSLKPLAADTPVPVTVAPSRIDPFEEGKLWSKNGSWWVFKKETYGWLKAKDGTFDVTIQRPKKPFYAVWPQGGKKVEWTIDNRDGDKIVYSIANNTFHRTAYRAGKAISEQTQELKKHPRDYRLTLEVSARHIVVSEAGNGKLDDFERADPGVQLGKIGFKGEIAVTVQRK